MIILLDLVWFTCWYLVIGAFVFSGVAVMTGLLGFVCWLCGVGR